MTGESGVALGRYFGGISGAGITMKYNHITKKIQNDHKLKDWVIRIRKRIINN